MDPRAPSNGSLFLAVAISVGCHGTGGAPTITPVEDLTVVEDSTTTVDFTVGDDRTGPEDLVVTASSDDGALLPAEGLVLGGSGEARSLTIAPAADASGGPATVTIGVTDGDGRSAGTSFRVTVLPVNDPPTTSGLQPVTVYDETVTEVVVDLHAAFDDVEDGPGGLTFEVVENANPVLFDGVDLDSGAGTLTLSFADHVRGHSAIVIRATDTQGASIERRTRGSTFPVYDNTTGEVGVDRPDPEALSLSRHVLLTSWAFFERVDGAYVVDHIDEDQLRRVSRDWIPRGTVVTCNIEVEEYFGNDALGRDNMTRVLDIIREERPDIELLGYYRLLPERQWHPPLSWRRAERDLERDLLTYYSDHAAENEVAFEEWHARSALYRTEPVSAGGVMADRVTAVFPSLYTFYRDWNNVPDFVEVVSIDTDEDTLTVADREFPEGAWVRLRAQRSGRLPTGLVDYDPPYAVVDADTTMFRISETEGGAPVDIVDAGEGVTFVGSISPWEDPFHDPDVIDWHIYAEENVAEARLFGVPAIAYISPSYRAMSEVYIEREFFRHQLGVLYPLVDGIVVYGVASTQSGLPENHEWWEALEDFMQWVRTVDGPATSFLVSIDRS